MNNASSYSTMEMENRAFQTGTNGFVLAILSIIVFFATFSNVLIIVAFIRERHPKNNTILVSLAVSDFGQGLFGYTPEILSEMQVVENSDTTCRVAGFSVTFLALASINHLIFLSIERAVTVVLPYFYHKFISKSRNFVFLLVFIWLISFLFAVLPLLGVSDYKLEPDAWRCSIDWSNPSVGSKVYIISLFVFQYMVPVIVMILSFSLSNATLTNLYQRSKELFGKRTRSSLTFSRYELNKKYQRMVFVMVVLFLLAWTPYAVVSFLAALSVKNIPSILLTVSAVLAKSSALFNVVVYSFLYSHFRRAVLRLITCKRVPGRPEEV